MAVFGISTYDDTKVFSSNKRKYRTILRYIAACTAIVCLSLLAAQYSRVSAAPVLTDGFSVINMPSGQSALLTDFDFASDGSYFTAGKNGRVSWVSSAGDARTIATFTVVNEQDMGLTGLAVAHNYAITKKIYTIRTLTVNTQKIMRLSEWTVAGSPTPTSLTNERTVIELPMHYPVHGMTTVVAAEDGTLWVSIGDSADYRGVDPFAFTALDINQGYGKLLHILPNGNGVATNPYYDQAQPATWKSRVYASGFRSPFRFSIDPTSGAPILGDVGYNSYEEVNIVRPGASYGWPCWEGKTPTPGYTENAACKGVGNSNPLWIYPHGTQGTSVTGGVVYTGNSYPEKYQGSYFFGDYSSRRVYTLKYDSVGTLTRQPEANGFGQDEGLPAKFATATNGDIIYADIGSSQLKRLVYSSGNRTPTAKASITNNASTRTVVFDGRSSTDLDGDALTYRWDFGDGSSATGPQASHTYAAPGTSPVTVKLTVSDIHGAAHTATYTVVPANNVPTIQLTTPPVGTLFKVGDNVNLSAQANDVEDGQLTVQWQTVLVHCSGGYCHDHPGVSTTGASFSHLFDDHGDTTHVEITARATDRNGTVSQKTYIAQPKLRSLAIDSTTPSAITVNGVASKTTEVTVGARVSIVAAAVASDGVATFASWADGAARERTLTMPDGDFNLKANYLTPIDRRYNAEAGLRATLGAAIAPEAGDASLRYRDYEQGRLYWTPRSGVHSIHGGIYRNYIAAGAHIRLGEPTTDELTTKDGVGRYNLLYGSPATGAAAIYWTPQTGANRIFGAIYQLWKTMGSEQSKHGYPTTDELPAAKDGGRYTAFQSGRIYWKSSIGVRSVHGAIYAKWSQYNREAGFLGFPLSNENTTPDGVGRYTTFEGGIVFWSPKTGAREVHGGILRRYQSLGSERSYLGYPTSDEYSIAGGKRSNFQNGYITWSSSTGQITDRRY